MTTTESVAPAANPVGTIQVTVCATLLQVHPPVEDDRLATVRFAGTMSVTVTTWVVGPAAALLVIDSVNVPVPLTAIVLVAGVFDSDNRGALTAVTVTVADAGAGVAPPPPVEVTVLVKGEPVPDATV